MSFIKQLKDNNINPNLYIDIIRQWADLNDYDGSKIYFSDKKNKKLMYIIDNKKIHFGQVGYNDYIIYTIKELHAKIPNGTAKEKRKLYRARATNIKGDWKKEKYSPNNLAINILW